MNKGFYGLLSPWSYSKDLSRPSSGITAYSILLNLFLLRGSIHCQLPSPTDSHKVACSLSPLSSQKGLPWSFAAFAFAGSEKTIVEKRFFRMFKSGFHKPRARAVEIKISVSGSNRWLSRADWTGTKEKIIGFCLNRTEWSDPTSNGLIT